MTNFTPDTKVGLQRIENIVGKQENVVYSEKVLTLCHTEKCYQLNVQF